MILAPVSESRKARVGWLPGAQVTTTPPTSLPHTATPRSEHTPVLQLAFHSWPENNFRTKKYLYLGKQRECHLSPSCYSPGGRDPRQRP